MGHGVYFVGSGKIIEEMKHIMVMKRNLLIIWQNVNSSFTHLKLLILKYFLQKF